MVFLTHDIVMILKTYNKSFISGINFMKYTNMHVDIIYYYDFSFKESIHDRIFMSSDRLGLHFYLLTMAILCLSYIFLKIEL
jgi:hypothetical protein